MREPVGLLFDSTRCIGCRQCVAQCQREHDHEVAVDGVVEFGRNTSVIKHAGCNVRRLCMHCKEPACVSVCPVGALEKLPWGPVIYHVERCIGCRYCMMACPFQIPCYEWDSLNPRVGKCDLCIHRTSEGRETACSWVCPTGATTFGTRKELLARATRLVKRYPSRYVPHIYGASEVGGTSTLLIAGKPFGDLGYRTDLDNKALPNLTMSVLDKLPNLVLTGALMLGGMYWIINRRKEVAEAEGAEGSKH